MPTKPTFVTLARVLRPQGRRGEVLAEILTDFPEKFAERRTLWLGNENSAGLREYSLENFWLHKGRVVLKFAGVDSISDAEAFKGMLVQLPLAARAALDDGSFYVSDLVGSRLMDVRSGAAIGVIEEVQPSAGSAPMLLVKTAREQYDIPLAQEYVVSFDVERKILEMKLPEGLLEVNAPLSREKKEE